MTFAQSSISKNLKSNDPTLKIEDFIHEIEEKHTLLTDNNSSANVTALGDFEICRSSITPCTKTTTR